jgi:hypothetical protein
MSTSAIKLLSLLAENLVEYGDLKNIQPYNFSKKSNVHYQFTSENGSNVDVKFTTLTSLEIQFTKIPPIIDKNKISSYFNVAYEVDGTAVQAKTSNISELLRIMKTTVSIVDNFLNDNKNAAILIFEDNKKPELGFSKGQKSLLYNAVISQNLPSGYTSREVSFVDAQGLIIAPK